MPNIYMHTLTFSSGELNCFGNCVGTEIIVSWRRKEGKYDKELQQVYDYLLKLHMPELIF